MELREFALRVLHGASLREKLEPVHDWSDHHPGPPVDTPAQPPRPGRIRFHDRGRRPPRWTPAALERPETRALLFHALANHELLAAELMALALLRFPDAPPAFRHGLAKTLVEEQRHTAWHLAQLRHLGWEFGDDTVSPFFWEHVAPMQTPADYVARLSLTFEQANLDFSSHYARLFESLGDTRTARIFHRIHQDEIAHVGYGLHWFRQWKPRGMSDWDAYRQALTEPLTPGRARGIGFDEAGRAAAGLDADFIRNLAVFSHSRGRSPDVSVFHPGAELEMVPHPPPRPDPHARRLAADLDNIPQFLVRPDDVVLVRTPPRPAFLRKLLDAGFAPPEFVVAGDGPIPADAPIRGRRVGHLRPWAWCPATRALLAPLIRDDTPDPWTDRLRECFSKPWSAQTARRLLGSLPDDPRRMPASETGTVAASPDEARHAVAEWRRRGFHALVVKAAFGLAGRGHVRLWEPEVSPAQWNAVDNLLASQGRVVVEPWRDRLLDLSIQLEHHPDSLRVVGFTHLANDRRGQFLGVEPVHRPTRSLPNDLLRFLIGPDPSQPRWERDVHLLLPPLREALRAAGHSGPVGIDAMVYRTPGGLQWNPVVEINPRFTFGRLACELNRNVRSARPALLRLVRTGPDPAAFAVDLETRFPVQRSRTPPHPIESGLLALNDPERRPATLALFAVGDSAVQALRDLQPAIPPPGGAASG